MFAYGDSARYRNGANYDQLPINKPINEVHNYNKDGPMRYRHSGNQPVYAPNSYGGPRAEPQHYREPSWFVEAAEIMRTAYVAHKDDNDFVQPGTLYRQVMSPTERDHLVGNIVGHLSQGVERYIQERSVKSYWSTVDHDLGARVVKGLGLESRSKELLAAS
jgi:catalase